MQHAPLPQRTKLAKDSTSFQTPFNKNTKVSVSRVTFCERMRSPQSEM